MTAFCLSVVGVSVSTAGTVIDANAAKVGDLADEFAETEIVAALDTVAAPEVIA